VTALLRFGSSTLSALLLVAVNLIPLIGVAFWGWSLMLILVLYWVESGIVGAINVMKIAAARGVGLGIGGRGITIRINGFAGGLARGALIGFFIFHYGMFWVVHGVFVFLLPVFAGMSSIADGSFAPADFGPLPLDGLALSALPLAVSHLVSYFANYIGRGESLRVSPQEQMMSVYGRVIVLHITIVAGASVVGLFGTPLAALVLLVGLKIVADLFFHLREHRRAQALALRTDDLLRP
jgi:hypothetical protein